MPAPLNILMYGESAPQRALSFRPYLDSSWHLSVWDPASDTPDQFTLMLAQTDVLLGGPIPVNSWPAAPRLRLYQIPWAGYDWALQNNVPDGVALCNCYEHEGPIAEYVMLTMLESRIGLRRMDATIRARGWDGLGPGNSVFHGEIEGTTVGVIGYGHIGEQVAKRAVAFGMRVIGVRRSAQPTPEHLAWLGTPEKTDQLLAESDFVLIACDLNGQTRGMINADTFKKMKTTAYIINVARGAIINEDDLYEALLNKHIGGAIIDTWYNYPSRDNPDAWPGNRPFHDLDNTILSAHESAWTNELVARRWKAVADNLRRLQQGEPLGNVVLTGTAATGDPSQ